MKVYPVGAVSFHAEARTDGQKRVWTDIKNLTVALHNLANSPYKLEV